MLEAMDDESAVLSKTPSGYLAVTPPGHRFHIGVMAPSEAEALQALRERVASAERVVAGEGPAQVGDEEQSQ